jgi:hypothetical protein
LVIQGIARLAHVPRHAEMVQNMFKMMAQSDGAGIHQFARSHIVDKLVDALLGLSQVKAHHLYVGDIRHSLLLPATAKVFPPGYFTS